jgi:ribonucleoside-diphosphate reductase alpha chain
MINGRKELSPLHLRLSGIVSGSIRRIKNLNQKTVVQAVAAMQQWIDTGISMELIFNLNQGVYFPNEPERCIKAKDIFETLVTAWESGCKAVYYIRTVQRDSFKEADETCSACAN